jgi:glycosyltransferase involved in cell wall biosynthesis
MAPTQSHAAGAHDSFKAYWFSQTIGLDRGLQSFIQAMARTRTRVTLDVRGGNRWGHGERLVALAHELGIGDRVNLLPMASPEEMVRLAASYDIGLSLETDVSENRRLCLTNKIFTYLLAGVPVLLSDTPAQRALASDLGAAQRLVSLADPAAMAATLDDLAGSPVARAEASASAWRLGRERYNWEVEKAALLGSVARAFASSQVSP